jgi:hypothetical protein
MPIFVETFEGVYVNADRIDRIVQLGRDVLVHVSGEVLKVSSFATADELVSALNPIIPAEPGFKALSVREADDGTLELEEVEIVGWRVGLFGPEGLTFDSDGVDGPADVIKSPSGVVYDVKGQSWPESVEHWLESKQRKEPAD